MSIYNRYILTTALILLLTTVVLAATGQDAIDVYYTVYVLEALVVTELYVRLNAKARRSLGLASTMLAGGFAIIIVLQLIRLLTPYI